METNVVGLAALSRAQIRQNRWLALIALLLALIAGALIYPYF